MRIASTAIVSVRLSCMSVYFLHHHTAGSGERFSRKQTAVDVVGLTDQSFTYTPAHRR
jgi:predicted branched-subunit amino acid permease